MDFIDYLWLKLAAVAVIGFAIGVIQGFTEKEPDK
jgi:hypothetical protein